MHHNLKTDSEYFQAVQDGSKTFELRRNDRHFKVGDTIILNETVYSAMEMINGSPVEYTGQTAFVMVTYVMQGYQDGVENPARALHHDWVIMGFRKE